MIGLSLLFLVLWLVVCMPELNNVMEATGSSLKIAVLYW